MTHKSSSSFFLIFMLGLLQLAFTNVLSAQLVSRPLPADVWDTENLTVLNSLGLSLIPSETASTSSSIVGHFDDRNPAGLMTSFLTTVSGRQAMLVEAMISADGELNLSITPMTLEDAQRSRPNTDWMGWNDFWDTFIYDSIDAQQTYDMTADTDGTFELLIERAAKIAVNTTPRSESGFFTFVKMYIADQRAEFDELPETVQQQMLRYELPVIGNVAFQPALVGSKNIDGGMAIQTTAIESGPHEGRIGFVDIDGRVWVRVRSQSTDFKFWHVQTNDPNQSFRIDNNGNKI